MQLYEGLSEGMRKASPGCGVVWARGCVQPRGGLSEGMRKASLGCGVVRARGCVKPRGELGKGMRKAAGWFEPGDA